MITNLTFVLLIVIQSFGTLNKDRLSTTVKITFHTTDQQILNFERRDSIQLRQAADGLVRSRKFQKAEVTFSTGEIAKFRGDGVSWVEITLHSGNQTLEVPSKIVDKLREIHFDDMFLSWSGEKETAFKSEYLNLVFASGTQRIYGQYPKIQLLCLKLIKWVPERAIPLKNNGIQYSPL